MEDDVRYLKNLCDKINRLGETEHQEIFKRIHAHGIPVTKNNNGVFINLNQVPPHIIKDMDDFAKFCIENTEELDEYDQYIQKCKMGILNIAKDETNKSTSPAAGPADGGEGGEGQGEADVTDDVSNIQAFVFDITTLENMNDNRYMHIKKKYTKRRVVDYNPAKEGGPCVAEEPYRIL